MRDHPHLLPAPPHNLLLQAIPAVTSHQMNMTVRNKRNGESAAKAGLVFQDPTCPMATVQKPAADVDISAGMLVLHPGTLLGHA